MHTNAIARASSLVPLLLAATAPAQQLDDRSFDEWRSYIRPAELEPWRELPWRASLLDAVAEASERNRPVLLWAMSGHPLGCT
ncbi:MAG: hypothetical protein AAF628_00110 [Planctomycetota bacterium]